MILSAISWSVNPEAIAIGDFYAIRWYGILFSLGLLSAYTVGSFLLKKEQVPEKTVDRLFFASIIGGVIGARLGHCFFYEPDYFLHHLIEVLYVWKGGLASHGGAIGILIAFKIVQHGSGYSYSFILSRAMVVVPLTAAFIRIGNLMNSEIYGHETSAPWGFLFKKSYDVLWGIEDLVPRHPTQIYEAIIYLCVFIVIVLYFNRQIKQLKTPSSYFLIGTFLIGIFGSRFFIEFFKENQVAFEHDMVLNMGQWLSIPFILAGLYSYIKVYRAKKEY